MVVLSGGMRIWVEVGGKEAEEYRINHTSGKKSNSTSCFIEAKEGKTFEVHYKNIPTREKHQTEVELSIDGTHVSYDNFCSHDPSKPGSGTFEGYWESKGDSTHILRAFIFGKTQVTSQGSLQDLPKHLKDEGCSIRVDISIYPRGRLTHVEKKKKPKDDKNTKRKRKNVDSSDEEDEPTKTPVVHKDSKPAILGLLTEPGEVIGSCVSGEGGITCRCSITGERIFHQVVIFRYLSNDWLMRHEYKKDPRAELQAKNVLAVKDTNVSLTRLNNEASGSKTAVQSTIITGGAPASVQEFATGDISLPKVVVKRRAGSEPLLERPSAKVKQEENLSIEEITIVKQEIVESNIASNVAAPCRIQVDATEEGDNYKIIKAPIEVIDISDDEC